MHALVFCGVPLHSADQGIRKVHIVGSSSSNGVFLEDHLHGAGLPPRTFAASRTTITTGTTRRELCNHETATREVEEEAASI